MGLSGVSPAPAPGPDFPHRTPHCQWHTAVHWHCTASSEMIINDSSCQCGRGRKGGVAAFLASDLHSDDGQWHVAQLSIRVDACPAAGWGAGVFGARGARGHGLVCGGDKTAAGPEQPRTAAPTTRSGHSRIREAIAIGIAIAVGRLGCCDTSNAHGEGHHQKSGGRGHGCSVVCGLRSLKVETADFDWLLVSSRFQLTKRLRSYFKLVSPDVF